MLFICKPSFLTSLLLPKSNLSSIESSNITTKSNVDPTESALKTVLGLGLAILAATLIALAMIILKKLHNSKVHYSVNMIYPPLVGIPISLVISLLSFYFGFEKRNTELCKDTVTILWQVGYLAISAITNLLTQLFFNIAVKYEDVSKLSIIRISDLLFTLILQALILNIYADLFSIMGAMLIFTACVLVILYKIVERKYTKNRVLTTPFEKFIFYKI